MSIFYAGGWQVQVEQVGGRYAKQIYIYRTMHDGTVEVMQSDLNTVTTYPAKYDQTKPIAPTLIVEEGLLALIVNAVKGIKPPERQYTEGKLEATENHLKDLRHLLKLPI